MHEMPVTLPKAANTYYIIRVSYTKSIPIGNCNYRSIRKPCHYKKRDVYYNITSYEKITVIIAEKGGQTPKMI